MGLIGVVVTQALGYGLIFDLNFFLRNLSVMGGLLMVLSDSWVRKKFAPAGLPSLDEKDRKMYFQLAGRVLLIFLFVGFVFAGDWSIMRVLVIIVGGVACVMVAVGFKAKWSAIILVMILSIFNIIVNNFWTVSPRLSLLLCGILLTCWAAAPTSSPQGLRQIRFLPDTIDCGWLAVAGQYGTWAGQLRREEEGILGMARRGWFAHCIGWALTGLASRHGVLVGGRPSRYRLREEQVELGKLLAHDYIQISVRICVRIPRLHTPRHVSTRCDWS